MPIHSSQYDLESHQFKADPHAIYAEMRRNAPICQHSERNGNTFWLITRYSDALAVSRAHQTFVKNQRNTLTDAERAQLPTQSSFEQMLNSHMLNQDGGRSCAAAGIGQPCFWRTQREYNEGSHPADCQ